MWLSGAPDCSLIAIASDFHADAHHTSPPCPHGGALGMRSHAEYIQ